MKKITILLLLLFIGWIVWVNSISDNNYYINVPMQSISDFEIEDTSTYTFEEPIKKSYTYTPPDKPIQFKEKIIRKKRKYSKFKCDGRKHCSQMNSYEEAKFFINNCPNTKMDGDRDGIPCERQFGKYY
jgi:uncharacterized protein YxeA